MHCLLFSLWLGAAPLLTNSNPAPDIDASSDIVPGQERVEAPIEAPVVHDSTPALPPARPPERRLSKGQRLLIGSGVAYGLGSAIQWATAGGSGMLAGDRPGATAGVTIGMSLGGIAMFESMVIGGIGARQLARESHGHDHLGKPLVAGGAVVAGLGAGAMLGTMMFWPSIRARDPGGVGYALTGLHLGGAALGVGVGMMSYGNALRQRDPEHRPLSTKARTPLLAGGMLFGTSYVLCATLGMMAWQDDPDDAVARRLRNRMLIPVVGPWIHAAGPDAPLIVAVITGGLGALQIGGAIALAVGAGIAGSERRRERERERVQVTVVPSFNGVAIAGRF